MASNWSLTLFDQMGIPKQIIPADVVVSWVLNGPGKIKFDVATSQSWFLEDVLKIGDFLLFDHADLGRWGGVLWPADVSWGQGVVTYGGQSAEIQFQRRRLNGSYKLNLAPGTIYRRAIGHANQNGATRIVPGNIYDGGAAISLTVRDDNILSTIRQVQRISGHDWWVDPVYDRTLSFESNWQLRRGEVSTYALREGVNLETPQGGFMVEQGDVVNDYVMTGEGARKDQRGREQVIDQASIDEYGLTQGQGQVNTESAASLAEQAKATLQKLSRPVRRIRLTALPEAFTSLRIGSSYPLVLTSVGFTDGKIGIRTTVRVIGMEYGTAENKAILTADEVIDG